MMTLDEADGSVGRICQNSRQISIALQDKESFPAYGALHIVMNYLMCNS